MSAHLRALRADITILAVDAIGTVRERTQLDEAHFCCLSAEDLALYGKRLG